MGRIIDLNTLSPKVKQAIVDGAQTVHLTLKKVLRKPLLLCWDDRERVLGLRL